MKHFLVIQILFFMSSLSAIAGNCSNLAMGQTVLYQNEYGYVVGRVDGWRDSDKALIEQQRGPGRTSTYMEVVKCSKLQVEKQCSHGICNYDDVYTNTNSVNLKGFAATVFEGGMIEVLWTEWNGYQYLKYDYLHAEDLFKQQGDGESSQSFIDSNLWEMSSSALPDGGKLHEAQIKNDNGSSLKMTCTSDDPEVYMWLELEPVIGASITEVFNDGDTLSLKLRVGGTEYNFDHWELKDTNLIVNLDPMDESPLSTLMFGKNSKLIISSENESGNVEKIGEIMFSLQKSKKVLSALKKKCSGEDLPDGSGLIPISRLN